MHGAPRQPPGFAAFAYSNPAAPKGGRLTLGVLGSFDSVNPLIIKGNSVSGVRDFVIESLMARALDEPFTLYGLLAESIDVPADRSAVTFHVNPKARFSDGVAVTADDVIFSHAVLRDHGRPNLRTYYAKVAKVERLSDLAVRFVLKESGDREMPLILGLMPVLPRHKLSPETFERTSLEPPLGSGPYLMQRIEPGHTAIFRRNPEYWGRDLPVNRGRYNFDEIRFDYFRDAASLFEAFKVGQIDLRAEDDPSRWAEGYEFPAVHDGRVRKEEFDVGLPAGMSALAFNTRRLAFQDARVRAALILLFDFEWINRALYHGLYVRTQSYFERSELSSHARAADARERELLARFPGAVKPDVLDGRHSFPVSDGTGRNRANAQRAVQLLAEAGYVMREGRLVQRETGQALAFEILAGTRAQERLLLTFSSALKSAGIEARVRQVDSAQYQARIKGFDFDMIQTAWPSSLSPGNEQLFRWSSQAALTEGTFNYPGVQNPAVDATIGALLQAGDEASFRSAVRALDRVLLSGDYVIPLFHHPRQWVAYWRRLEHPATTSLYGYAVDTWWIGGEK